jgi:hypothetical protein
MFIDYGHHLPYKAPEELHVDVAPDGARGNLNFVTINMKSLTGLSERYFREGS